MNEQPKAEPWKTFEIRRAMICHEDGQINFRVNLQLVTQSFLFTAAVILLKGKDDFIPSHWWRAVLLLWISVTAIVLGLFFYTAVRAARREQSHLRGENKPEGSYNEVFPIDNSVKWSLQASGKTFWWGYSFVHAVQLLSTALWIPILIIACTELARS